MEKSIYKREIQELSLPLKKLFKNKSQQQHLRESSREEKENKGKCQPHYILRRVLSQLKTHV
jgi:hypothetical protein